jgi:hypothetical protein
MDLYDARYQRMARKWLPELIPTATPTETPPCSPSRA